MNDSVLLLGATGAIGSVFLPRARAAGLTVIPHVRTRTAPAHALGQDPSALVCDLDDAAKLDAAMARCDRIVCLVGTMRRRFASGDTYESSDLRPVVLAVESALRVRSETPRFFVLLSSLGARKGPGYPGWKFRAEEAVRGSGLPHCILRPSIFDDSAGDAHASDGTRRKAPRGLAPLFDLVGKLPGLRGVADDLKPIRVGVLANALVRITKDRAPRGRILQGRELLPLGS